MSIGHVGAFVLWIKLIYEPCHEIMVLFVLRKLILQTRMRSHPMGLDVWFLIGTFVNFHTSCVRTAKALSPEPSLVAYVIVISTILSRAGSYINLVRIYGEGGGGKAAGAPLLENPYLIKSHSFLLKLHMLWIGKSYIFNDVTKSILWYHKIENVISQNKDFIVNRRPICILLFAIWINRLTEHMHEIDWL